MVAWFSKMWSTDPESKTNSRVENSWEAQQGLKDCQRRPVQFISAALSASLSGKAVIVDKV